MKKEVNEQEAKEFKTGVVKKGLAIGLVSATCAILAGCSLLSTFPQMQDSGVSYGNNSGNYQNIINSDIFSRDNSSESSFKSSDYSSEANESSSNSSSEEIESDPVPYEDLAKLLHKIETSNYAFRLDVKEDGNHIYYHIDGDKTYVKNVNEKTEIFYYNGNGKYYKFIRDENDYNTFYKYIDEDKFKSDMVILNVLRATNWISCDAGKKTVTGVSNGKTYTMSFGRNYERVGDIDLSGDINGTIGQIGTLILAFPGERDYHTIIDKTSEKVETKKANKQKAENQTKNID